MRLAVDLAQREAHRDAHEERLRQFDPRAAHMQEVTVVERLQAEKLELQIALGLQRGGEPVEIETGEFGIEQFGRECRSSHSRGNIRAYRVGHLGLRRLFADGRQGS